MLLLAAAHGRDPQPRCVELCDEIADDVLATGWNKEEQGRDLVAGTAAGNHLQAYFPRSLIRYASC